MPSITELSGYQLEPLREDANCKLYRGRQLAEPSRILLLSLTEEHPSPNALRRLKHEYSLASKLDAAWAAQPLALTHYEGRMSLVLRDPGGEPLNRVLERRNGQHLDLIDSLRIAVGLATTVGQVHRHGLIHKDIKPENILVNDVGGLWLTGFGIASQLPREFQAPAPPEIIAGTLAYMAPEQTGRMNRSIDNRSDLYSLGVTLYQMITGVLPFTAGDALEWVHCHIARQPIPPVDRAAVPERLSAIIVKLLAKNAEERYQTASGLEADLRRCLAEWQSHGRVDSFPLGAQDKADRLLIPEKLYGREREVDALLAAFDRVVEQGTPELVLVSGYSGVGKSSLVNELHTVLVPPRGLFASGKFDQYKRDIPYSALALGLQTLIRQILVKSEGEVGQWRSALVEAVGPNGQLMVNLIPELEFIIGKQSTIPESPAPDAQNRFRLVFRRFLCAFARPEHPLALFLDDLQWADVETLDLLEHLITDPDVRHLMVIGAYRDNEVNSSHPLVRTLGTIRAAGARMQEIVLASLQLDDIGRLVADALRSDVGSTAPLAQLVHEKTGGNPFFAIQFFTELAEEGLLELHHDAAAWIWDLARIRAKGYTDNVVGLMVARLKRLSGQTQEALRQLACLGNEVEIATLTLLHEESEEDIHGSLLEATRSGVILRREASYGFLHDRVQEASYALIPEGERAAAHLRIGRVLLASMTADSLAEHLFDVANQFDRGAALLVDHDEQIRVAAINLNAGRKAKASAGYTSALAYFSAGAALLDQMGWGSQYGLTFSLWLERAECELLSGNFGSADRLILELLQHAKSKIDKAAVYDLRAGFHLAKSENQTAVTSALTCLRLFDIDMPTHPTLDHVQAEYETVWQALHGREIETLIDLPLITDPELKTAMRALSTLTFPAILTDFHLFCLNVFRMVKISMQHGTSAPSAHGYAHFGSILGHVFHRYRDGHRFLKLACNIVEKHGCDEKHGFTSYRSMVHYLMGMVAFWTEPIAITIDFTRTTFRAAIETGNPIFACYAMSQTVTGLFLRNDPLDAVWRELWLPHPRPVPLPILDDIRTVLVLQQRFIATMQGRTANFSTFSDAEFDEAIFEAQLTEDRMALMTSWYWILKLKARFLSGDYAEALAAADKVKPLLPAASGQIQLIDYYYYAALAVAARYESGHTDEQAAWHVLLTAHGEQLREWAEINPPTFGDKHALVSAEIASLDGRAFDAMQLYEQAIQSAHANGFVQNEGLAYEVAARFYLTRGFKIIAHTYLRNARNCYDCWGAPGKVNQLDELYPHLHEKRTLITSTTISQPVGQLDAATVVKASQALSSEMVLPKLIEKLMRLAMEHAGAERGLLILLRDGEPRIEAEATTAAQGTARIAIQQKSVTPSEFPESVLHYVIRTGESVVLNDASVEKAYTADEYVQQKHSKSVLCLPIVKQTKLVGALYLENNLTTYAFSSERIAVLELLAAQAAISLENASLYSDLQRSGAFLAEGQRLTHTGSWAFSPSTPERVFWSPEFYRIFGLDPATNQSNGLAALERVHPEDRARLDRAVQEAISARSNLDIYYRVVLPDGKVKHLHTVSHTVLDQGGEVIEMVGTSMDVTEQVQSRAALENAFEEIRDLKDQLYRENLALRDEVDRASMFEEIVGTSEALQTVLSRVAQVAPTNSTVLITGETGTGKELIARAIHKRSNRSGRAFVSVNCAALAPSLIASELFGHEKGAFTGASQRRLGRFELAHGGTIFLDEVGELPSEIQIALLRVLQEREFERVGGAQPVKVDVRIIAATNRDLKAATTNVTFRPDLFYRLNVFPIEVPPLRKRKDDILVLLEYFVKRYAGRAGKNIRSIDKKTLELFQSYHWPGNIRELQNVVERSVIVSSTPVLSVDESWFSMESPQPVPRDQPIRVSEMEQRGEREIIEAALTESRGRISGPAGAAAKLRIPPSTLASRIKALKIRKSQYKFG